ncbi:nucleotidyltransferase family protein [Glycomyces mayteni]|uniref:Nucleotidyltransferase family protein n=1 Tax=Glycomyces mayteni TaxID=543887 RepID=A0ABW2DD30_9ACTN
MERNQATAILEEVIANICRSDEWPVNLISSLYVFGSYAQGSPRPGDIDVAIELEQDERWVRHTVSCIFSGRNWMAPLNLAIRGKRRSVQIVKKDEIMESIPLTLLWRRRWQAPSAPSDTS